MYYAYILFIYNNINVKSKFCRYPEMLRNVKQYPDNIDFLEYYVHLHVSQPSSSSNLSSSSSREGCLGSGCVVVTTFGFLVALGALGFFVGFGALGFLVGFGGFGFLVGLGAFCFFALASFSAAFFALASERWV